MNSIKSVSTSIRPWIGAKLTSVPHRDLGWLRRKFVQKMTAWQDGFEVSDGPNNFNWLNREWLVQFGVVRGVICKIGLTHSCGSGQSQTVQDVATTIKNVLGMPDENFSRPAEGAFLWQANDGTIILQAPPGLVVVYFNSLFAIRDALTV